MEKKFNPKITFKFIENIWQKRDHRESENAIKLIYKKQALPHSFTEIMFSKSLKSYESLTNSKNITKEIICSILRNYKQTIKLSDEDEKRMEHVICEINNMDLSNDSWIDSFVEIFKTSISISAFNGYEIEMAKLLSNYRLISENKHPIIMYCYASQKMANIAYSNGENVEIKKILNILIKRTNKFNKKHEIVPLKNIVENLLDLREELMISYGVTHLGIFGSYSREEQNEYSDLDIICEVRDDYKNISNLRDEIATAIKEKVEIDVDVMINDVTYDADQIPVDMFTEEIKIF